MNFYARLADFFLRNRALSVLLTLASFAFGALAFVATPKQYNPEITLPAFRITTAWPGATAAEVEQLVTNVVEQKLVELPGVDEMQSQSFAGGQSVINLQFEIGNNLSESKTKVLQKMAELRLPSGAAAPRVAQLNPENVPILTLTLTGEKYSVDGLRAMALDLREQLRTVPGVGNVAVIGGAARQISVLPDPARLAARGITLESILQSLRANNLQMPVGELKNETQTVPVELVAPLASADAVGQIVVGGTADSPVHLADVAVVKIDHGTIENIVELTKRDAAAVPAVHLALAKTPTANIGDVTAAVTARLAELQKTVLPPDVTVAVTRDDGATARAEVALLTEHLALAIGIVSVTLLFFLGWRAAIVVALAIPLTLALVFIIGFAFDQTINRITLFALIFSLGLLVDDAIVVVENVYRHFAKNPAEPQKAIALATGEVGLGVLLSTLTAVIVFLPMGLVSGLMGAYMGPIAFFAPVARLASLVVAYTLSPFLAHILLRPGAHATEKKSGLERWYERFIARLLASRWRQNITLIFTAVFVLGTFSLPALEFVHFRMLPKADRAQFFVQLDLPADAALPATRAEVARVTAALLAEPNVAMVESFVGTPPVLDFNGLFRGSDMRRAPNLATLKVDLTPKEKRAETSEEIVAKLRPAVLAALASSPGTRVKMVEDPPGPPVLATLLARVTGPDPATREAIARDLLGFFRATPGVTDIDSTLPTGATELAISLDRARLAAAGLSAAAVAQTLQTAVSGTAVGSAHLENSREESLIVVRLPAGARTQPADLAQILLPTPAGPVALANVIKTETVARPAAAWHDARENVTLVTGELAGRAVVYAAKDLIFRLLDYRLPDGHGVLKDWNLFGFTFYDSRTHAEYRIAWGGEFEMTLKNFRDLGIAMGVAMFLIYVLLVAQFQNFRAGLLIMSTILLGFAGVLGGFALLDFWGVYFSATAMIGAIALGGIVVGNAILLLDFILQRRAAGDARDTAIAKACAVRFRPIALTSLTAVLGALVIVADPVWSGLAWALTFGLGLSTVLTLVIFPVLYLRWGGR